MAQYRLCDNYATCGGKVTVLSRLRFCNTCRLAGCKATSGNQHTVAKTPPPPVIPTITPTGSIDPVKPIPPDTIKETETEREQTLYLHEEVRTLEDLVRVCKIDLAVWDIVEWHANKWEMGYKDAKAVAHTQPLFQVRARMRRKSALILTMQKLREELVQDIRVAAEELRIRQGDWIKLRTEPSYPCVDNDWLFEFSPFDLHMGKLTWDEETITNYDIKIAEDLFNAALDFLLARAQRLTGGKIARVLCVFGNDVSHIDSKRGETTAGTHMDVDSRYIKVYRRIVAIHRRAVDVLREVAPVDCVIIPGNHDELTSFHLGEILAAIYENDPRVTVDNSPKLRKYYEYGTNLFGFTHGDSEKVSELPLLMARENPDAWARCGSREWHIGHKHISEKFEARARFEQDFTSDKGIRVRRLTSLSGHDAWHTKHAYTDRRACEGFVFHRTAGFTDHLSFNVDHFTGKGLTV